MTEESSVQSATRVARKIARSCVGARVRMLNRVVTRIYDDLVRPHGIKFSQMNILTVVALYGPLQAVEIARRLALEKSTLSRNLRLMEDNGWIRSLPGVGNARLISATGKGGALLKRAAPDWRRAQRKVTALLGEKTTEALRRSADRATEDQE